MKLLLVSLVLLSVAIATAKDKKPKSVAPPPTPTAEARVDWWKAQSMAANSAIEYLLAEKKFNANNVGHQEKIKAAEDAIRKICAEAGSNMVVDPQNGPTCVAKPDPPPPTKEAGK